MNIGLPKNPKREGEILERNLLAKKPQDFGDPRSTRVNRRLQRFWWKVASAGRLRK